MFATNKLWMDQNKDQTNGDNIVLLLYRPYIYMYLDNGSTQIGSNSRNSDAAEDNKP